STVPATRSQPLRFAVPLLPRCALPNAPHHDHAWPALATLPSRWAAPVFPLKASVFMKRGGAQGPALGAAMAAAEHAWIVAGFPNDAAGGGAVGGGATPAPPQKKKIGGGPTRRGGAPPPAVTRNGQQAPPPATHQLCSGT